MISNLEELSTQTQRENWFLNKKIFDLWSTSNQIPLTYMKSNEWLINWVFYLISNFKAKQIPQYHANSLDPTNLNLMSEIDLKHFILSVQMKNWIKTKLLESYFWDKNCAFHSFFWKALWLLSPSMKN